MYLKIIEFNFNEQIAGAPLSTPLGLYIVAFFCEDSQVNIIWTKKYLEFK